MPMGNRRKLSERMFCMSQSPKRCIFCTTTSRIIDLVPDHNDGAELLTKYSVDYGNDLIVLDLDVAYERFEQALKSDPVEITEERWYEMLGVLPPVAWRHDASGESFKISERTAGSITAIFVRVGSRFFEFSDTITLPHQECTARVRAALKM